MEAELHSNLLIGISTPEQADLLERAAIIEFEGGFPRDLAEEMARELWEKERWKYHAEKYPWSYTPDKEPTWKYFPS